MTNPAKASSVETNMDLNRIPADKFTADHIRYDQLVTSEEMERLIRLFVGAPEPRKKRWWKRLLRLREEGTMKSTNNPLSRIPRDGTFVQIRTIEDGGWYDAAWNPDWEYEATDGTTTRGAWDTGDGSFATDDEVEAWRHSLTRVLQA